MLAGKALALAKQSKRKNLKFSDIERVVRGDRRCVDMCLKEVLCSEPMFAEVCLVECLQINGIKAFVISTLNAVNPLVCSQYMQRVFSLLCVVYSLSFAWINGTGRCARPFPCRRYGPPIMH